MRSIFLSLGFWLFAAAAAYASQPYRLTTAALPANGQAVIRETDGATIPRDPLNVDWQKYETWLAAGNTPDAAAQPTPEQQLIAAIAAGCQVVSASAPGLNGTYAIDDVARANITAESLYIQVTTGQGTAKFTNGQATKGWPDATGAPHTFNTAQFIAFAEGMAVYYDALIQAQATARAGGGWSAPAQ